MNTSRLDAELCLSIAVKGDGGDLLSGLWYVGVILSIVSSIASNLGVNVQKYSMMQEIKRVKEAKTIDIAKEKPYVRQPLWLGGLLMVILGAIGDFAALGFAAQSLATPVGGFTLIANLFFGHFWLKEALGKQDLMATGLVLVGLVFVALSADKREKTFSLDCLLELYKRKIFIIYVVVIFSIWVALLIGTLKLAKLRETDPQSSTYLRFQRIHPVFPAALSGIIGSQSVLFAKCTAEIFKITFTEGNEFDRWQTYIIIFCMIVTIFNQLHWLAHSLRFFDAVLIVPIFQCFFILGGVVGGGVFFDEFSGLSSKFRIMFACGLIITLIGVLILTNRKHFVDVDDGSDQTELEVDTSVERELKTRLKARLSTAGSQGNGLAMMFGIPPLHADDPEMSSSNPLYGRKRHTKRVQALTLDQPHSMPEIGPTKRNDSVDSASSAPFPLGVGMAQFAFTDLIQGVTDELQKTPLVKTIRRASVFSHSESRDEGDVSKTGGRFTIKRMLEFSKRKKEKEESEAEGTQLTQESDDNVLKKTFSNNDDDDKDLEPGRHIKPV